MSANRNVVVVLGMHRGGTSLVAGMLEPLGVRLGANLVAERLDNPRGFFEHREIVDVHRQINRLLQRRPMSRSGALDMPEGWTALPEVQPYRAQLREILESETQAAESPWGFKDPHTVRLLALWKELFEAGGYTAHYLLCLREPSAVCDSLARRDNVPREHAELLWLMHYLDAVRHTGGSFAAILEYERWFNAFDEQYAVLAGSLAGVARPVMNAAQIARASIEAGLNHRETRQPPANALVNRLYAALSDRAAGRVDQAGFIEQAREIVKAAESLKLWSRMVDAKSRGPQLASDTAPLGGETRTVAAGGFPVLEQQLTVEAESGKESSLKICIVTYELEGPTRCTETAAESADMAVGLARLGHAVTLLHVPGEWSEDGSFSDWVEHYKALGVTLVALAKPRVPNVEEWLTDYVAETAATWCRVGAYNVYQWLRKNDFDVVHGFDTRGALYYCLLAKRLRMHFPRSVFHVRVTGPEKLRKQQNAVPVSDVQELANAYMERRSVEYADVVTAAGEEILLELAQDGCTLPGGRTLLLPFIGCRHEARAVPDGPIREFVFSGSMETRKGLNLFVDAINWLQRKPDELRAACGGDLPRVHFIGSEAPGLPAAEFLQEVTANWQLPVSRNLEAGRRAILDYLGGEGRLAVLPSASPLAAIELDDCLHAGIHLVAARTPAHRALSAVAGGELHGFDSYPGKLAECLLNALKGLPRLAAPAGDGARAWARWHADMAADAQSWRRNFPPPPAYTMDPEPLVSVCIAHFNRPRLLSQVLASLEKQSYRNFEVIVVDDGSTVPEAVAYLEELETMFKERGWTIVRQENRYLGAVRNTGARHARGKYCLFMDDDNYAKENEIQTFVTVAERTGAHILTCFADVFSGDGPPDTTRPAVRRITQLGDNLAMGLFRNGYGDSNCFVRRRFFLDVGGNSEDYKVGNDDQEFFSRAVLSGAKLFVVPEALYWYRESEVRMRSLHYRPYAGNLRVMRPFLAAIHPAFRDILRLAQGQLVSYQKHRGVDRFQKDRLRTRLLELLDGMQAYYRRVSMPGGLPVTAAQVNASQDPGALMGFAFDRFITSVGRKRKRDEDRHRRELQRQAKRHKRILGRDKALQQLLAALQSRSWRWTRPLRKLVLGRTGEGGELTLERAAKLENPLRALADLYASVSWQITAPVRLVERGARRLRAGLMPKK